MWKHGDGAGAIASVERIVTGLRMKKVQEPILALKEVTPEVLAQCEELGTALAAAKRSSEAFAAEQAIGFAV